MVPQLTLIVLVSLILAQTAVAQSVGADSYIRVSPAEFVISNGNTISLLEASTGKFHKRWEFQSEFELKHFFVCQNRAISVFENQTFQFRSNQTGELECEFRLPIDVESLTDLLLVDKENQDIVCTEADRKNTTIYRVRLGETPQLQWQVSIPGFHRIEYSDKSLIAAYPPGDFPNQDEKIFIIDGNTGQIEHTLVPRLHASAYVFFGHGCAYSVSFKGMEKWELPSEEYKSSEMRLLGISDEHLFVRKKQGFFALNQDFEKTSEIIPVKEWGMPVCVDDEIVVLSSTSSCKILDSTNGQLLGEFPPKEGHLVVNFYRMEDANVIVESQDSEPGGASPFSIRFAPTNFGN